MGRICAIILAAGESKRMGFSKMLLIFNGITMLENVIRNVTGSEIDYTLVVLGADGEKLTELVSRTSAGYCYNENYKEGMLSSVRCGFRNLPSDFEAVLVFQGDQPLIIPKIINRIIEEYRSSDKGILIPVCNGERGHPVLIDRKFTSDILTLDAGEGLHSLARKFPEDVLEVETGDPGILRDFDTYDEYKKEINQTG
jgi:molybdenum cofactor cytidylyltransferase